MPVSEGGGPTFEDKLTHFKTLEGSISEVTYRDHLSFWRKLERDSSATEPRKSPRSRSNDSSSTIHSRQVQEEPEEKVTGNQARIGEAVNVTTTKEGQVKAWVRRIERTTNGASALQDDNWDRSTSGTKKVNRESNTTRREKDGGYRKQIKPIETSLLEEYSVKQPKKMGGDLDVVSNLPLGSSKNESHGVADYDARSRRRRKQREIRTIEPRTRVRQRNYHRKGKTVAEEAVTPKDWGFQKGIFDGRNTVIKATNQKPKQDKIKEEKCNTQSDIYFTKSKESPNLESECSHSSEKTPCLQAGGDRDADNAGSVNVIETPSHTLGSKAKDSKDENKGDTLQTIADMCGQTEFGTEGLSLDKSKEDSSCDTVSANIEQNERSDSGREKNEQRTFSLSDKKEKHVHFGNITENTLPYLCPEDIKLPVSDEDIALNKINRKKEIETVQYECKNEQGTVSLHEHAPKLIEQNVEAFMNIAKVKVNEQGTVRVNEEKAQNNLTQGSHKITTDGEEGNVKLETFILDTASQKEEKSTSNFIQGTASTSDRKEENIEQGTDSTIERKRPVGDPMTWTGAVEGELEHGTFNIVDMIVHNNRPQKCLKIKTNKVESGATSLAANPVQNNHGQIEVSMVLRAKERQVAQGRVHLNEMEDLDSGIVKKNTSDMKETKVQNDHSWKEHVIERGVTESAFQHGAFNVKDSEGQYHKQNVFKADLTKANQQVQQRTIDFKTKPTLSQTSTIEGIGCTKVEGGTLNFREVKAQQASLQTQSTAPGPRVEDETVDFKDTKVQNKCHSQDRLQLETRRLVRCKPVNMTDVRAQNDYPQAGLVRYGALNLIERKSQNARFQKGLYSNRRMVEIKVEQGIFNFVENMRPYGFNPPISNATVGRLEVRYQQRTFNWVGKTAQFGNDLQVLEAKRRARERQVEQSALNLKEKLKTFNSGVAEAESGAHTKGNLELDICKLKDGLNSRNYNPNDLEVITYRREDENGQRSFLQERTTQYFHNLKCTQQTGGAMKNEPEVSSASVKERIAQYNKKFKNLDKSHLQPNGSSRTKYHCVKTTRWHTKPYSFQSGILESKPEKKSLEFGRVVHQTISDLPATSNKELDTGKDKAQSEKDIVMQNVSRRENSVRPLENRTLDSESLEVEYGSAACPHIKFKYRPSKLPVPVKTNNKTCELTSLKENLSVEPIQETCDNEEEKVDPSKNNFENCDVEEKKYSDIKLEKTEQGKLSNKRKDPPDRNFLEIREDAEEANKGISRSERNFEETHSSSLLSCNETKPGLDSMACQPERLPLMLKERIAQYRLTSDNDYQSSSIYNQVETQDTSEAAITSSRSGNIQFVLGREKDRAFSDPSIPEKISLNKEVVQTDPRKRDKTFENYVKSKSELELPNLQEQMLSLRRRRRKERVRKRINPDGKEKPTEEEYPLGKPDSNIDANNFTMTKKVANSQNVKLKQDDIKCSPWKATNLEKAVIKETAVENKTVTFSSVNESAEQTNVKENTLKNIDDDKPATMELASIDTPNKITQACCEKPTQIKHTSPDKLIQMGPTSSDKPTKMTLASCDKPIKRAQASCEKSNKMIQVSCEKPTETIQTSSDKPTKMTQVNTDNLTKTNKARSDKATKLTQASCEEPTKMIQASSDIVTKIIPSNSDKPTKMTQVSTDNLLKLTQASFDKPTKIAQASSENKAKNSQASPDKPTKITKATSDNQIIVTVSTSKNPDHIELNRGFSGADCVDSVFSQEKPSAGDESVDINTITERGEMSVFEECNVDILQRNDQPANDTSCLAKNEYMVGGRHSENNNIALSMEKEKSFTKKVDSLEKDVVSENMQVYAAPSTNPENPSIEKDKHIDQNGPREETLNDGTGMNTKDPSLQKYKIMKQTPVAQNPIPEDELHSPKKVEEEPQPTAKKFDYRMEECVEEDYFTCIESVSFADAVEDKVEIHTNVPCSKLTAQLRNIEHALEETKTHGSSISKTVRLLLLGMTVFIFAFSFYLFSDMLFPLPPPVIPEPENDRCIFWDIVDEVFSFQSC